MLGEKAVADIAQGILDRRAPWLRWPTPLPVKLVRKCRAPLE